MSLIELWRLRRDGRALLGQYHRLHRRGKHLSAYAVGCYYNNFAHRYNLSKPRWLPAMSLLSLEAGA